MFHGRLTRPRWPFNLKVLGMRHPSLGDIISRNTYHLAIVEFACGSGVWHERPTFAAAYHSRSGRRWMDWHTYTTLRANSRYDGVPSPGTLSTCRQASPPLRACPTRRSSRGCWSRERLTARDPRRRSSHSTGSRHGPCSRMRGGWTGESPA